MPTTQTRLTRLAALETRRQRACERCQQTQQVTPEIKPETIRQALIFLLEWDEQVRRVGGPRDPSYLAIRAKLGIGPDERIPLPDDAQDETQHEGGSGDAQQAG